MTKEQMLREMVELFNYQNKDAIVKNRMKQSKRRVEEGYNLFKRNPTKEKARFCLTILTKRQRRKIK